MSEYIFRGKPISGIHAWGLRRAVRRVMQEAPNPTAEDPSVLEKIAADFEEKFAEDMKKAYPDPEMDWSEFEET